MYVYIKRDGSNFMIIFLMEIYDILGKRVFLEGPLFVNGLIHF
jgi:hypothetical protein